MALVPSTVRSMLDVRAIRAKWRQLVPAWTDPVHSSTRRWRLRHRRSQCAESRPARAHPENHLPSKFIPVLYCSTLLPACVIRPETCIGVRRAEYRPGIAIIKRSYRVSAVPSETVRPSKITMWMLARPVMRLRTMHMARTATVTFSSNSEDELAPGVMAASPLRSDQEPRYAGQPDAYLPS